MFRLLSSTRLAIVSLVFAAILVAACGGSTGEQGEGGVECDGYPTRDIDFVVPYEPGGAFDGSVRLIAPFIEKHLPNDVRVVVRNEPGAGGQTGTARTFAAEPDGTRIQIVDLTGLTAAQITGEANFDLAELTYLGRISTGSRIISVAGDSDIEMVEDLVELSESRPVKQATTGATTTDGVAAALIYDAFGIEYESIAHDGNTEARLSVVRGDSDAVIGALESSVEQLRSGDLRAILYFSEEKPAEGEPGYEEVRDVQTIAEAGYPELGTGFLDTQRLIGAPPGTPDCIRNVLDEAIQAALADPEFLAQAEESELPPDPLDAAESEEFVRETIDSFSEYEDLLQELVEQGG